MSTDDELERIKRKKLIEMTEMSNRNTTKDINDESFDDLISSSTLAVVDFWAEWCAPCRVMHPVMEKLAGKYAGRVTFARLNVDQNQDTPSRYAVFSIPTFIFFKAGQMVDKVVGAVGEQGLERVIAKHL